MPNGPLLEIDDISWRVEAGDLSVLDARSVPWLGLEAHHATLRGDPIAGWSPDARFHAGLFVSEGRPSPVPGIRTIDIVHRSGAGAGNGPSAADRQALVASWCGRLDLDPAIVELDLSSDLTTADATKLELLQLALLEPDVAIIDLTSTPPDVDVRASMTHGLSAIRIHQAELAVAVVTTDDELICDLRTTNETTHASTDVPTSRAHRDETLL